MTSKAATKKPFNKDEVFEKVLKFYIGKGIEVEEANRKAMRVVNQQMKDRGMI